jgi:hypothetical protein
MGGVRGGILVEVIVVPVRGDEKERWVLLVPGAFLLFEGGLGIGIGS